VERLRQGLAAYLATGAEAWRSMYLGMLAAAHEQAGQIAAGLSRVTEALEVVAATQERWWESELYRLRGVLLLEMSSERHTEAEACFHQAIAIARHQQAKSWELRAATSLARLWQSQGKRQEAFELFAPVYGWFTEGFDTADVQEAKQLLVALR
jgi:predicted ATPase